MTDSWIGVWLNWPAPAIFGSLLFFYGLTGLVMYLLVFHSPLSARIATLTGVVAPFFSAVAILFALLAGFLASDVGDRNRQAVRTVQAEAAELRALHTLSVASASDMREIRSALQTYVTSVLTDEWPAMADHRLSPQTSLLFDDLLRKVSEPKIAQEASAAVHSALLHAAVSASTARSARIALAGDRTNDLKWLTVLLLGVMTQLALASVHLDKSRANAAALTIFSLAAVLALGLIALQEQPFDGVLRIKPSALQDIQTLNGAPG